jgi:four helix bundle protein
VPTNIAEGCGQGTDPGLLKFLHISFGSLCELESLCLLTKDLGVLTESEEENILEATVEVKKMLCSLIQKIKTRIES